MTDDRNIDTRQMRVTKVEDPRQDGEAVVVTASALPTRPDAPGSVVTYVTTPGRAPRVGILVLVTIEAIR